MQAYLIWALALVIASMNLAAFLLMRADKARARRGQWRIRESTLFLVTALFGGLGGTLGMVMFHHKTRHWYFRWGFPMLLIIQGVLLGWLIVKFAV